MDYNDDLKDTLEGDLLGSNVYYLCYVSVFILVVSLLHFYTFNISNAVADVVLGLSTLYFVTKPSIMVIVCLMSYSISLACTSMLLLIINIIKHPAWVHDFKKRIDFLMFIVDVISAATIFSILNKVWKSPAYINTDTHNLYYYDNSMYKNNVWTPFTGMGDDIFSIKASSTVV